MGVQAYTLRVGLFNNNNVAAGIDSYIAQMGSQLGMQQADLSLIGQHDVAGASRCLFEGIAGRGTYLAPAGVQANDVLTEYRTDSRDSNGAQVFGTGRMWFQCEVTATPGIVPTGVYWATMNAAGVSALRLVLQNDGKLAPGVDNTYDWGINGGPRPRRVNTMICSVEADRGLIFTGQTNQAGAGGGTLTNAPAAGNPAIWIPVVVNGVNRAIPAW